MIPGAFFSIKLVFCRKNVQEVDSFLDPKETVSVFKLYKAGYNRKYISGGWEHNSDTETDWHSREP